MPIKYTVEEIIEMIKEVHGDVVKIDATTYNGTQRKCRFIDKDYGEWWTTPHSVAFQKKGSRKRWLANRKIASLQRIKIKLFNFFGDKITIDETTYTGTNKNAKFIDKELGEWWAQPNNVINRHQTHPSQIANKSKKTWLKKYGVDNPLKCDEIKEKAKQTNIIRYGVENPLQNEEIRTKILQNNLEKYGFKYPIQNKDIKEKARQTNLERYGFSTPTQNKDIKEKMEQENLKKYGVKCTLQVPDVKKKIEQTNLERYGAINPMQNPEVALRSAKSANNSCVLKHWFSGEEIVCTGSYEKKVIEYFNKNYIDYNWQPQVFLMPDKRTYRPDCYLPDLDMWIEIKGYFRDDAEEKWSWFHKEYINSELWNRTKLKKLNISIK